MREAVCAECGALGRIIETTPGRASTFYTQDAILSCERARRMAGEEIVKIGECPHMLKAEQLARKASSR